MSAGVFVMPTRVLVVPLCVFVMSLRTLFLTPGFLVLVLLRELVGLQFVFGLCMFVLVGSLFLCVSGFLVLVSCSLVVALALLFVCALVMFFCFVDVLVSSLDVLVRVVFLTVVTHFRHRLVLRL